MIFPLFNVTFHELIILRFGTVISYAQRWNRPFSLSLFRSKFFTCWKAKEKFKPLILVAITNKIVQHLLSNCYWTMLFLVSYHSFKIWYFSFLNVLNRAQTWRLLYKVLSGRVDCTEKTTFYSIYFKCQEKPQSFGWRQWNPRYDLL